jgi:[acyl-carrier-protein] S-malonyltransferase
LAPSTTITAAASPRFVPTTSQSLSREDLKKQMSSAVFAFRGYDVTNLGRTRELLLHPVYAPVVRAWLDRASIVCSEVIHQPFDLPTRVLADGASTLDTFAEDIATIVAAELAQIEILETIFDIPVRQAPMCFGHSIGELSALVFGGVYEMEQLLKIPLQMAHDCAELTNGTTIGILSSHAQVLEFDHVQHLCSEVSSRGHGLVGASTYLSPYHVLLLGQADTLDTFELEMRQQWPHGVTLKRRPNHWPPLHTPLVWQRNIPNRTAVALHQIEGGHTRPMPPVVSCVTGHASYDQWNSRDILAQWTDHPQCLWNVLEETLSSGVNLIVHTGPDPKLISSTFDRLGTRIMKQLKSRHLDRLGRRVIPSISRNHWLTRKLPTNAVLLRAPFVNQLILEDWLLAQDPR